MKRRVLSLLMACVLVFGTSTTVLAAGSSVVDNTNTSQEAINGAKEEIEAIPEITDTTTAEEAKDAIVAIEKETVLAGMQKTEFVESVKAIETDYATAMGITPAAPSVSTEAAAVASNVSIVGSALNADAGSTVQLVVDVPTTEVEVEEETYENAVQLEIKLEVNSTEKSVLEVPVSITMDIPAGVNTTNLVILHYHGNATTPETIIPEVNGTTMTFAVDKFSTFVVANEVQNTTPAPVPPVYYPTYVPTPDTTTETTTTSPKTGETAGLVTVCAVIAMAATATIVIKRKEMVK